MFVLTGVKYKDILDIDKLSIPAFQVTCILGESGSGKTTLIKLLNRMLSYDSGEIMLDGKSLNTLSPIELRRKVIMLSQNPAIFSGTIKDNLLIGLKFSEKPLVPDQDLVEILEMIHLKKSLEENAENLSGGEKQRIALGRVLITKPDILLLDEPSSALDENTENFIIEKIKDYTKQNNKTLIMVTHSKKAAYQFADYLITLSQGKVIDQKEVKR